jgi:hypothetical protein
MPRAQLEIDYMDTVKEHEMLLNHLSVLLEEEMGRE